MGGCNCLNPLTPTLELGKYGLSRVRVQEERKSHAKNIISNKIPLKNVFNAVIV